MTTKIKINAEYLIFSTTATLLLLWNLWLPGYVMTLDAVFGPRVVFPSIDTNNYFSNYIWQVLNYWLANLLGGMWAEKFLLFFLFFVMFYLPFVFFPFEIRRIYRYLASVLFVINPFVLERFLAGQWGLLMGYDFLFVFIYYLLEFLKHQKVRSLQKVLLSSFLVGVFSFHLLVVVSLILLFAFVFVDGKFVQENFRHLLVNFGMYVLLNLYWVYPYLTAKHTILNIFNQNHFEAFQTNILNLGVFSPLSIFTLYGFWGERELWAKQFAISPFTNLLFYLPIFALAVCGIFFLIRKHKKAGIFLTAVLFFAAIFSLGVSETLFQPVNQLLFDHVFFWSGFRDSQKWSAAIALLFAIFVPFGLNCLVPETPFLKKAKEFLLGLFVVLCAVFYCLQMLFAIWFVVKPVQYPDSWYQVNEILKNDKLQGKNCSAVFLPWHMYYSLPINNNLLTGNPANKFFDCNVYTSLDPEFYNIGEMPSADQKKNQIDQVLHSDLSTDDKITQLQEQGIDYVIVTRDAYSANSPLEIQESPKVIRIFGNSQMELFWLKKA